MERSLSLRLIAAAITFLTLLNEAVIVNSCPAVCLCYVDESGLRTANCSGVKFISESNYNKVFYEIEVLNLRMVSENEPVKLWDDMFVAFAKLKILNLDNCRINFLPKSVFKGLKKIYEINLASNDIRHVDNAVFENIYNLNKLNLRGNQLQGSNKPLLSSNSLRELDIGYCGIAFLQNEIFHGVKKLTRLYLDGNHLQTVKEHVLPRGITHLNLANNRIVNVPVSTINSLSQLRWLDLGANPINCTCSLLNLQDILSGHAIIMDGDLRCAYPPELENVKLSKVNENEICNKEIFSSRYHFKKSQTSKYATYQKKEYYFENEKYNPFELQGDDPGTSADDYQDAQSLKAVGSLVKDDKTDPKKHEIHSTEPDSLVETTPKNTEINDNNKEETSSSAFNLIDNKKSELTDSTIDDNLKEKVNESKSEAGIKNTDDNTNNKLLKLNETEEEIEDEITDTTQLPFPLEGDEDVLHGNSHGEIFDDNMKDDQVLPVASLPHQKLSETSGKSEINANTEKNSISNLENTEAGRHSEEVVKKQQPLVITSPSDEPVKRDYGGENEKTIHAVLSGVIDSNEVEGSGDGFEENVLNTTSPIPLFHHGIYEITEEPIRKTEIHPDETFHKIREKTTTEENENVGQIVDKKPINYEEMGPHIVVGCIIVFIVVLIFVSVYKGFCKSKEANRKPLNDVESNPGTELQDITSSLLPKSPPNDEKHNNKYPNEVPSTETVNLIKTDKAEEPNGAPDTHDLNQNDSKNDNVVIKNGKTNEMSPPPIEKTKAKLTVLLESIPRTPIFVQKRPTTLNNG